MRTGVNFITRPFDYFKFVAPTLNLNQKSFFSHNSSDLEGKRSIAGDKNKGCWLGQLLPIAIVRKLYRDSLLFFTIIIIITVITIISSHHLWQLLRACRAV